MDYEIVYLEEKNVAGLKIRTSNSDPNMVNSIGGLWQEFFTKGIYQSIPNKYNDKSIGLYTNYESDDQGEYDMMVCCEVINSSKLPVGVYPQMIPAGKYAKFVVKGDMQKVVAEFWTKLWSMNLDRKFSSDFEEYQSGSDNIVEIHIYIALNSN
ncbi:MAG: AraC family transcriptional regulator [Firmicutes bacterium HGW-Firmicutes-1]|nr:MAG: AraC family transcriptional regulator [Firmicutes bacterium HGW-Firmicutes-1]